jgi:hypothetical protein
MKNEYLTKIKVNYSISKNVIEEFNKVAKENAINKSGLIELFIKEWTQNNKK